MQMFQPDNEDLKQFLEERRFLSAEVKSELGLPSIYNKKDAFGYWIEVYRQDQPVYLYLALLGLVAMAIFMLYKIALFFIA